MRFKDKAGNVFANIKDARASFCPYIKGDTIRLCDDCPIASQNNRTGDGCDVYAATNPAEAARLMGYEVLEDEKEEKLDKTKPVTRFDAIKACETPQEMVIKLHTNGIRFCPKVDEAVALSCSGRCKECIVEWLSEEDDVPALTDQEMEDVRTIVRLFGSCFTRLVRAENGVLYLENPDLPFAESVVVKQGFPSIRPGQAVILSNIVGGGE